MHYGLFLIPIISAFMGWFIPRIALKILFRPREPRNILGLKVQGIFPKKQGQIAYDLAKMVSEQLLSMEEIEQKIADPAGLEKLMPMIEVHIDDFLRVKLAKKMPVISMFIGDKTITELKSVFMDELQELFPVIMKNYAQGLKEELHIEAIIADTIGNFPPERLETIVYRLFSTELKYLGVLGATIGFIIGLIQAFIACLI